MSRTGHAGAVPRRRHFALGTPPGWAAEATLASRSLARVSVHGGKNRLCAPIPDLDTSTPLWRAFAALSSGFPCDWPEPLRHRGGVAGDDRQVNRESLRHRGDERMHVVEDILRR